MTDPEQQPTDEDINELEHQGWFCIDGWDWIDIDTNSTDVVED
jgi:hypothetical protein